MSKLGRKESLAPVAGTLPTCRLPTTALALLGCAALLAAACARVQPIAPTSSIGDDVAPASAVRVERGFGSLPLHFEANRGQAGAEVGYLGRGPGYEVYLTPLEAVLALGRRVADDADAGTARTGASAPHPRRSGATETSLLKVRLVAARAQAALHGQEELPGKANYFAGNDPSRWLTNVPLYAKVRAEGVYPGVDLVYYGNPRELEYDFVVSPGADPSRIRLSFEGQAAPLHVDAEGNLVIPLAGGELLQRRPVAYQEAAGRRQPVAARFVLEPATAEAATVEPGARQEVGFAVASYDAGQPLVIDPVLAYSTYIGEAQPEAIAVDGSGSAYLAGAAGTVPIQNAYQPAPGGGGDAFVTKLTPDGSALVYSTYLGGSMQDGATGIAVDSTGAVYVAGLTSSADFPTTPGALQTVHAGAAGVTDGFVTKLDAAGGALVYSTYLGGGAADYVEGLAVDAAGNAYLAGRTSSADFPVTSPAFDASLGGSEDAFAAKLNPAGSALEYSTYLGGSGPDFAAAGAVDGSGSFYVAGLTLSGDFPTKSALQGALVGTRDVFVTKLSPNGKALTYSTFLGGHEGFYELASGLAVDQAGNAIVVGTTDAADFPTQAASQGVYPGGATSGFVTKLGLSGNTLVYSTYLGGGVPGSPNESVAGVAVDSRGAAYVTGNTEASDFPTLNAFDSTYGGTSSVFGDAFVTKLTSTGGIVHSSYLGGTGSDTGTAIALRPVGITGGSFISAYVTGVTGGASPAPGDFPTHNAFSAARSCVGNPCWDMFVTKLAQGEVETQQPVLAGGTVTANPGGQIEVSVTSPNAGEVTIVGGLAQGGPLAIEFDITAPVATAADPLILAFRIDAPLAGAGIVNIIRNLQQVPPCTGAPGTASPDPCIASTTTLPDGDLLVTVNTSAASLWTINDGNAFAACPPTPQTGCQPAASQKSKLQLINKTPDKKDKLTWQWISSATVAGGDFGDPFAASAYQLCLYSGGTLRFDALMPAGELCAGRPCWRLTATGYLYSDKDLTPYGISKMTLRAGAPGKGKIVLTGKGESLSDTALPLALPVAVQLARRDDATCWEATYSAATTSKSDIFKAKSD
jgi:Beta-propeller repeat